MKSIEKPDHKHKKPEQGAALGPLWHLMLVRRTYVALTTNSSSRLFIVQKITLC
jgi:hypothetical protein